MDVDVVEIDVCIHLLSKPQTSTLAVSDWTAWWIRIKYVNPKYKQLPMAAVMMDFSSEYRKHIGSRELVNSVQWHIPQHPEEL